MTTLLQATTRVADLLFAASLGRPALALVLVGVGFGVVALLLYRLATPQAKLRAARGLLIGRLYEAALYQTSLPVILRVQGALALANLRYVACALPGLAVLVLPLLIVVPQLEARLGRRPLGVGEVALVTVTMAGVEAAPRLVEAEGLRLEAGPVRDVARGALVWRVRGTQPGWHELRIEAGDQQHTLAVPVAVAGLPAVARARHQQVWRQALLDPTAPALPVAGSIARIEVEVPARQVRLLGTTAPWLLWFSLVALAAGLALKKPLRVEL